MSLQGTVTGGWSLRTVNASTLQLGPPVQLPFLGNIPWFSVTSGVSGTDDVWMNDGGVLLLLNTATGKIVRKEDAGLTARRWRSRPTAESFMRLAMFHEPMTRVLGQEVQRRYRPAASDASAVLFVGRHGWAYAC